MTGRTIDEPMRLKRRLAGQLGASVLESARLDVPSAGGVERVTAAVLGVALVGGGLAGAGVAGGTGAGGLGAVAGTGAGGLAAGVVGASKGAASGAAVGALGSAATAVLVGKAWVVGTCAVLGAATVGGMVLWQKPTATPTAALVGTTTTLSAMHTSPMVPAPSMASALVVPAETTSTAEELAGVETTPKAAVRSRPAPSGTSAVGETTRPRPPEPTASAADSTLVAEIALLDEARLAIAAHKPRRAMEVLDRYERTFPTAGLRDEAKLLRIEALAAAGDKGGAAALAREYLEAHPRSPYAQRVRAITAQ